MVGDDLEKCFINHFKSVRENIVMRFHSAKISNSGDVEEKYKVDGYGWLVFEVD